MVMEFATYDKDSDLDELISIVGWYVDADGRILDHNNEYVKCAGCGDIMTRETINVIWGCPPEVYCESPVCAAIFLENHIPANDENFDCIGSFSELKGESSYI